MFCRRFLFFIFFCMEKSTCKFHYRLRKLGVKEYNSSLRPYIYFKTNGPNHFNIHVILYDAPYDLDDYLRLNKWWRDYLVSVCKGNNLFRYDIWWSHSVINHVPREKAESVAIKIYDVLDDLLKNYKPNEIPGKVYDFSKWGWRLMSPL